MKGRLASRAHSFKENILGAFGSQHQPGGVGNGGKARTASASTASDASGSGGEPGPTSATSRHGTTGKATVSSR